MAEPKILIPLPDDMDRLMKLAQWQASQIERLRERVFELEADPNSGDVVPLAAERAVRADRDAALELSWVPLKKRDLTWHASATTQLRAMHAALHAAEKTPRDPLEIEELWDEANGLATGEGPEPHELFARLLERAHGIGVEHG